MKISKTILTLLAAASFIAMIPVAIAASPAATTSAANAVATAKVYSQTFETEGPLGKYPNWSDVQPGWIVKGGELTTEQGTNIKSVLTKSWNASNGWKLEFDWKCTDTLLFLVQLDSGPNNVNLSLRPQAVPDGRQILFRNSDHVLSWSEPGDAVLAPDTDYHVSIAFDGQSAYSITISQTGALGTVVWSQDASYSADPLGQVSQVFLQNTSTSGFALKNLAISNTSGK